VKLDLDIVLDRGGAPAYAQIIERIEAAVVRGELAAGDRLPPERQLAEDLGVSRMTLRQALAALQTRGLVTRTTGRRGGTFVASPKVERDVSAFAGLSEQLRRQNVTAGSRVLAAVEVPAGDGVAEALELEPGDPVAEIVRVRLADREPLALERSSFPVARFPGLLDHDLTGSLYDVLAETYCDAPTHAVERLEPVLAGKAEADALAVSVGAPLMLVERIAYAAGSEPVEFARDLFRGDRTRIVAWATALSSG
jgi:GntR family transcriptional regulator